MLREMIKTDCMMVPYNQRQSTYSGMQERKHSRPLVYG